MPWRPAHHKFLAQLADAVTTILSFVVSYYVWRFCQWQFPIGSLLSEIQLDTSHFFLMMVTAVLIVIIFNAQRAYWYQRFTSFATEVKIVWKTVIIWWLLLVGMVFLFRPGYIPRTLVVIIGAVTCGLLIIEKFFLFQVAKIVRLRGTDRKRVLVVGTGDQTKRFVETIRKHFFWGLDIVGFLDAAGENVGQEFFGKPIIGTFSDITSVLRKHPLDEVIITVSTRRMGEIRNIVEVCEREGVQVRIVSDFLGKIAKRIRGDVIYDLPIISISYIPDNKAALAVKRLMDVVVSAIALILLWPLFLLISILIKISSPGPIFYEWNVVGFNKKPFRSWKFRTMVTDADKLKPELQHLNEMEGPVFKIKDDPRVTPFGKILRKYSLDELPQLWSVLTGDMSLVGPRPAGPHELVRYESWQRRKLSIKPGVTCLWQVNGRNEIYKFDDWVRMDLAYIDNWSLWLDIKILLKTLPAVFLGKGAS